MLISDFHGFKELKHVDCPSFYPFRISSILKCFCSIIDKFLKGINSPWTLRYNLWCNRWLVIGSAITIRGFCGSTGSCPPCTLPTPATPSHLLLEFLQHLIHCNIQILNLLLLRLNLFILLLEQLLKLLVGDSISCHLHIRKKQTPMKQLS